MKTAHQIKEILAHHKKELRVKDQVKQVGIFGSYARSDQKKKSDIDVVAEFEEPLSLLDLVGVEIYLSRVLKAKVDLIPKKDIRPELKERILKETVYV